MSADQRGCFFIGMGIGRFGIFMGIFFMSVSKFLSSQKAGEVMRLMRGFTARRQRRPLPPR